jgi:hypothetical protein
MGIMNPNNCETCYYKAMGDEEGHCYMFKDAPTEVCAQHSGREDRWFVPAGVNRGTINLQAGYVLEPKIVMSGDLEDAFVARLFDSILEEDDRLWVARITQIIRDSRRKLNKRKKQRRATTGRRR